MLLDHDVPAEVAHVLRHWGHDVVSLRQALPVTTSDDEVFRHAVEDNRLIVSCNRAHFVALAEDTIQAAQPFPGLVVLIRRRSRHAECAHLFRLLARAGDTGLKNNINFA